MAPATAAAASSTSAGVTGTSTSAAHATGGTNAPTAQSAQEMADRVASALNNGFSSGGELRVRVEPPALGKVQIQVQADAGSISARIEVQTPAAQKTLLDNISMLHDAIGQTGATVGHIEIEVAPQQQNANDANQRDGGSGASNKIRVTRIHRISRIRAGAGTSSKTPDGGRTPPSMRSISIFNSPVVGARRPR